jgi:protein-S-isoprenylcysteine O-methyltransferase Ste14
MWLFLKNAFFAVVVPGTVALWFPLYLAGVRERGFGAVGLAQLLALALVVAGFATILIAIGFFGVRGRGTPAPFDPPTHLVARGPHRFVRNPMYVGVIVVLLGWALWFQSTTLVVYAAIAWLCFHMFVLLVEEPVLRRRFGPEYAAYCHAVRRWIPGRGFKAV